MDGKKHMDANAINQRIAGCLQEKDPPCVAACPLGLDVHNFIKKLKRGSVSAAYRMYREAAVFPQIAARICHAPCRKVCQRCGIDAAVQLRELEYSCAETAGKKPPDVYHIPSKGHRVSVVGGGLSGMTCALRLTAQGYDVTVYEREEVLGGTLCQVMEPAVYLEEFQRQFTGKQYTLKLGEAVEDLDALDCDAVYIATGAGGADFRQAVFQDRVFRGGSLTGAAGTEIIRDGIRAAADIKAYLDLGFRDREQETGETVTALPINADLVTQKLPVKPADGHCFSKAEAVMEADRCLLCRCTTCQQECDLLNYYSKTPRRVADDVYATLHQVPSYTNRMATRFSNACNQCGKCADVCPQGIDLGRLLLDTRREMYADGYLPEVFHHFWLRDMEFSTGEAALSLPEEGTVELLFFPGCSLGASDFRYVTESWRWLRETYPSVGILLSCCGAPALWGGAQDRFDTQRAALLSEWERLGKPTVVFACPTCQKLFREAMPHVPQVSLYQLLADKGTPAACWQWPRMYLFDPCSARHEDALKTAVRQVAALCGAVLENPSAEEANDSCCGWGGHILPADPALHSYIVEKRIAMSGQPYLTYCANCRDTFAERGKESYHILDLAFGLHIEPREKPDISRRRDYRRRLKRELKGEPAMAPMELPLHITAEQQRQMERDLISREEVLQVIQHAEQTGVKLLDEDTQHRIAHSFLGNSTCWVEYVPEEDGTYTVFRVYSHRMRIEGEKEHD